MTCSPVSPQDNAPVTGWPVRSRSEAEVELLREVERRSSLHVLSPGHVVFREGDEPKHLYLLKMGDVIFTIVSSHQTIPCFAVGAGSLLGLSAVVSGKPFALSATASPDAEVMRIAEADFHELIEGSAARYMAVLQLLAEETHRAHQALVDLLAS